MPSNDHKLETDVGLETAQMCGSTGGIRWHAAGEPRLSRGVRAVHGASHVAPHQPITIENRVLCTLYRGAFVVSIGWYPIEG
eukprot:5018074-Prymnesium_polylepis.1